MSNHDLRASVKNVQKIAEAVKYVSKALKDIETKTDINMHGLVTLIAASTKLSPATIKKVIAGIATLEDVYLKPKQETEEGDDL